MLAWSLKKFKLRSLCLITTIILLLVLAVFVIRLFLFANRTVLNEQSTLLIDVSSGATFIQFTNQMLEAQLFTPMDKRLFIALVLLTGKVNHLRMGEYQISSTTTIWQLLEKITKGLVLQHKITFPEGITFQKMLTILKDNPDVTIELAGLPLEKIRERLGVRVNSLEGIFYPDTYLFPKGTSDRKILQKALERMRIITVNAWLHRADNQPYKSAYDALIAASLIERETADKRERFLVSAVIANRLRINMLLQIDPTVIYGMGHKYQGVLTRNDLKYPSPYNTYLHLGLPPSPIALPSGKSIFAALHPLSTKNLFYVSKGDGTHLFANTLREHLQNIQLVKQQTTVETSYESSH